MLLNDLQDQQNLLLEGHTRFVHSVLNKKQFSKCNDFLYVRS